jgi:SAM-dependent methyltransferase
MRFLDALAAAQRSARRVISRVPLGAKCQCNMCGRRVQRFLPYRGGWADVPPLIRQLGVVGSDVDNYECPACGCHDRERHLLMYLKASGLLSTMKGARILHLAPERHLQRFIRDTAPIEYIQGDLYPAEPSVEKIDLQALPYPADYFDFILANHVLEHVQDDMQALGEIYRTLRFGGHAILQTPFSSILTHLSEDAGIRTDKARLHAYGQEDHYRLYGKDIVERFKTVGLLSLVKNHSEILVYTNSKISGVNPDEPFFLFKKDNV